MIPAYHSSKEYRPTPIRQLPGSPIAGRAEPDLYGERDQWRDCVEQEHDAGNAIGGEWDFDVVYGTGDDFYWAIHDGEGDEFRRCEQVGGSDDLPFFGAAAADGDEHQPDQWEW